MLLPPHLMQLCFCRSCGHKSKFVNASGIVFVPSSATKWHRRPSLLHRTLEGTLSGTTTRTLPMGPRQNHDECKLKSQRLQLIDFISLGRSSRRGSLRRLSLGAYMPCATTLLSFEIIRSFFGLAENPERSRTPAIACH